MNKITISEIYKGSKEYF